MISTRAEQILANCTAVKDRIAAACSRARRAPGAVELMAVTKYASSGDIAELLNTGLVRHIGESRLQSALQRWKEPCLAERKIKLSAHFIGHLQSNKAAKAAEFFDFIDSVDDIKTAEILNRKAGELGKNISVLIQVKLTTKETQSGVILSEAPFLADRLRAMPNLTVSGYMGIAPEAGNPEELRPLFREIKKTFDHDFPSSGAKSYLSLGMSHDFEIAVEEGSNLPRIGSALFAPNA